ncbi:MAG TPA: hypothetical protein VED83_07215 [Burkholderiaceae bacterium]|nr:hypothetical protein [Burkholderiaceae bacterium]
MPSLQMLAMYTVITVMLLPLLLFFSIPFLLASAAFNAVSAIWLDQPVRRILASGVAALGIAPAYDTYLSPRPIYTRLLTGEPVELGASLLSIALTWVLIGLVVEVLARRWRLRRAPNRK